MRLPNRALSVRQPWAWAILNGGRMIENRSWYTSFRGTICIHAARTITANDIARYRWIAASVADAQSDDLASHDRDSILEALCPRYDTLPLGGIVGVVDIVDCIEQSNDPWFMDPRGEGFGFVFANPRPIDFIPVKGAPKLFSWRQNIIPAADQVD